MPWPLIILYLFLVNLVTALLWVVDKRRAVEGRWRISEATLLGLCLLGGWPLGLTAAELVRHKTRKPAFIAKVVAVIAVQVAALCAVILLM